MWCSSQSQTGPGVSVWFLNSIQNILYCVAQGTLESLQWMSACCLGEASCLAVLACWHCLTWTCAAGVRELNVNQLKPWPKRCESPTWPKEENKLESHRSERKASYASPPGQRYCSAGGPQRQDTRSLGAQSWGKGARGFRERLRMPFINMLLICWTSVHPAHHASQPSLPLWQLGGEKKEAWKVLCAGGNSQYLICQCYFGYRLYVFLFAGFTRTVWD